MDPGVQAMCLEIISGLWTVLQTKLIKREVLVNPQSPLEGTRLFELFRFFLHGTNVVPFIKHQFDPTIHFPYTLSSDFDCEVLINPSLDKDVYTATHKELLDVVFQYLIAAVKHPNYWHLVTSNAPLRGDYPIGLTGDIYTRYNKISAYKGKYNTIPKESPFYVYKVNELYVQRKETHISQVKFGIRIPNPYPGYPYKMIDLIDVSIPKQANPHITHLWNITNTGLGLYKEDIEVGGEIISVRFPRLNVTSAIQNLDYAANAIRETREEKREKRMTLARNLQNFQAKKPHPPRQVKSTSGGNRRTRRKTHKSRK